MRRPPAGIETASHPHANYGAAVMDAIRHGFQPDSDRWIVVTAAGITRFDPPEEPGIRRAAPDSSQPGRPSVEGQGTQSKGTEI